MGLLTQQDSTLFRKFFKEMAKLRGISVKYIYPVDEDVTIYAEIKPKFSSIFNLDIIFETLPKVKTLKNYGWFSENDENKPYIAYLPYDTPHIQTKSRIQIPTIGNEKEGKWFEITDIQQALEFPDTYICKLAPIYETEDEQLNYSVTNNNYVEGDNQPDQDVHHNKFTNQNLQQNLSKDFSKTLDEKQIKLTSDNINSNNNFTFLKL